MLRYSLRLYVSDAEGKDQATVCQVQSLCSLHFGTDFEITVIDVNSRPELAQQERILATPALVKANPLPRQCVVGDLHDPDLVLGALALWDDPQPGPTSAKKLATTTRPR